MTTPTIYPTGYAGDDTDYLKAKADRSGAVRQVRESVTITAGSSVGTVCGIHPFQAGARLHYSSVLYMSDGSTGAGTLLDIGYVYESTAATDDTNAFIDGSTVIDAGGFTSLHSDAAVSTVGMEFTSTANGWFVAVPDTAAISTAADVTLLADLQISYDITNF